MVGRSIEVRNRDGRRVDPVPFLVASTIAFTACFSFGPAYLVALGIDLGTALVACGAVVAGATAGAYRRYVLAARPGLRGELPPAVRLRRFARSMVLCVVALSLLALPLALR